MFIAKFIKKGDDWVESSKSIPNATCSVILADKAMVLKFCVDNVCFDDIKATFETSHKGSFRDEKTLTRTMLVVLDQCGELRSIHLYLKDDDVRSYTFIGKEALTKFADVAVEKHFKDTVAAHFAKVANEPVVVIDPASVRTGVVKRKAKAAAVSN
jgi:hypothetical protein